MKVLASSWHPGGINAIIPVIQALRSREENVVTIGYGVSRPILQNHGIPYKTLEEYGFPELTREATDYVLDHEKPDVILCGTSAQDEYTTYVIEQLLTLGARERGIPTLSVLDYWRSYSIRYSDIYGGIRFRFLPTKIAVMDAVAYEDMRQEGFDMRRVCITGNPAKDRHREYHIRQSTDRQEFRKHLGLEGDAKIVLYPDQPMMNKRGAYDNNIRTRSFDALWREVSKIKRIFLVARPHPRADISLLCGRQKTDRVIVDGHNPFDYLRSINGSDLVVTVRSSALMDAAYLKVPSIGVQDLADEEYTLPPLLRHGLIPDIRSFDGLSDTLSEIFANHDGYVKRLEHPALHLDGNATERVLAVLQDLAENWQGNDKDPQYSPRSKKERSPNINS